ncbi:MAG TPA: OmpA family protein [Polyangiaceae bacterium]|nr:OmpA family protein [Polyangiaceae bacterium]
MSEPVAPPPAQEPQTPAPPSTASQPPTRPRAASALSTFVWLVIGAGVAALLGISLYADKSAKKAAGFQKELVAARAQNTLCLRERDEATKRFAELDDERQRLSGELRETAAQRQATQSALEKTQAELAAKLAGEIKQGEVVIRLRGGDLVVDVSDKILFDTGKAEVSSRGQSVLKQVAASISRMPRRMFQVSGHTDAERIKSADVRERFATNWELSTARATNVVRFLQEKCGIPGRRLVAAGYAEHQPVASNATENGKQRNRRIEIALIKEVPAE